MREPKDGRVSRRTALKATGGFVGGFALGGSGVPAAATAQADYYRYHGVLARLVNVDARPPQFRTVRTALYLTEPRLADCDTDQPCSIDVLGYERPGDDDDDDTGDDDDQDDDGGQDDDDGGQDDDDDGCPGFASVVLLCPGESPADAVVLTGLMPDVLAWHPEFDYDFVVELSPSNETNVNDPTTVPNPCPTEDDGDDDGNGGNDDGQDDDGGQNDDDDGGGDDDDGDDDDDGNDDDDGDD